MSIYPIIEFDDNDDVFIRPFVRIEGLIAVAQFRNVKYGSIIYAGDDLTNDTWDSRKWKSRTSIRMALVSFCRDVVKSI